MTPSRSPLHSTTVGVVYSDTTVSGNSEVAEKGELVVMMGGSEDAYSRGRPIFEAIGRSHHHVGPIGSASRMKLIVNHALTVQRMALAEALVVAELAGMDLGTALDVLKDSLAYSKVMDVWGDRMVAGDHEFPYARLRQSHKDARLIVEHGLELGATMDLARVATGGTGRGRGDRAGRHGQLVGHGGGPTSGGPRPGGVIACADRHVQHALLHTLGGPVPADPILCMI